MGVNLKKAVTQKENIVGTMTREDKFYLRYQMYNDNFKDQVLDRLKEIYEKASQIKIDKQLDLTNNIYTTLVERISRVYNFGVDREIANEELNSIYSKIRLNKTMNQANVYLNAFNDVLLQVAWNTKKDIPKLIFRLPHRTKVALDENNEPQAVEYYVDKKEDSERWAYWSDTEHYYKIYDNQGEFKKESINNGDSNPYGTLPFVFMQNGFRDDEFFDMYSGDDMINITLDNAVYSTFKNYLIKWQSFKQLVVTGNNIGALNGQMLDPATALTAQGEDVKIDLLDLQANLEELRRTIDASAEKVALNYNISPSSFNLTSQVTSGFSKLMENAGLDEFTRNQQDDFVQYENELNELLVLVGKINNKNYAGDFNIKITKPFYPESREASVNVYEKEMSLGLINPIQILMKEKSINEEEAKAQYEHNLEIRNKAYKKTADIEPLEDIAKL